MECEFEKIHSVAIIGSRGQMGGFLALTAERAGLMVYRFDTPLDEEKMARRLPDTDLVILCIPVTVMDEVLPVVIPHLKKGAILSDVGSVKGRPVQQMLRAYDGPVVGTHPLFGPVIPTDFDPTVALVAEREEDRPAMLAVKDFFERLNFGAFESSVEEHDKAMAMIQALNFSSTIAFLACSREIPNIKKFVTPSFKRRLESARKMVTQDSDLFGTITDANQYSQEATRLFRSFLSLAAAGDMDLLADRASWWWRDNNT
ncbi:MULTISPECIES: prephenate dehydrogenase/arogenate dehydrogenase family protein [unclassified Maridesulfovibrio]|uniref:prephenate dehydrogenase/arogenate dehydrogenase family protein n=1 Tax=unclassified Maridesulfovibrio TaxID=2794999 RepID=UPI003B3D7E2C